MKLNQINYFLETMISSCSEHPSIKCRIAYYDILIWLYDNLQIPINEANIKEILRKELLKGLTDESQLIRTKLSIFWNK